MNDRTKTASPKSGVLEKHDALQTVQAPTTRILAKSIRQGVHTMLQGQSDPRPAQKSTRRGFGAKKATITITKRADEAVPAGPDSGEEGVQPRVEQELESGQGES